MTVEPGRGSAPRILVLAPNWLGDVVMATPLLNMLAGSRFGADEKPPSLVLAVRRVWVDLFRHDPRLDGILVVERTGRHAGYGGLFRLARDMKNVAASAVVLGPPSLRAGLAARLAGIPLRAGFKTDGRGLLLQPGLRFPGRGVGHYSNQLLDLGREIVLRLNGREAGGPDGAQGELLQGLSTVTVAGLEGDPPLWAMGVGATYGQTKVWPTERVWAFLAAAVEQFGVRVVLLGHGSGFGDHTVLPGSDHLSWRRDLAGGPGVVDLVGRTSLPEVTTILRHATVFVGNDSGLMHLAAALGTPTVGIFGSSDPRWTAPLGAHTAVVQASGFACIPCFRSTCNQPRFCLEALDADRVLETVRHLISPALVDKGEDP